MLVSDVIKASMRKLGVLASGEAPTTNEYADGLSALQSMLRAWAGVSLTVFASVKESFTLVSSTALYTWGSGGTFDSARPNQVIGAYVRDSSSTDHPVDVISEARYRAISVKATTGRPYALFMQPTYPLANVYLYPVPQDAESLYTDSFKPFTETSSFDSTSATLAFPLTYEEALIYNHAVRFGSEFGRIIPADVVALAVSSYDKILNANAAQQVEPVRLVFPAGSSAGGRYSINSDSSR